jgi:hypothetical protein
MGGMFAALLDTCVLWPSLQRDFLLSMAAEGLYRPLWSEAILDELYRHEQRKLIRRGGEAVLARQAAEHLLDRMNAAFADAVVTGWEPLEGSFGLPDADDEHVVAAAVIGGAGVIVTDNVKHFPAASMPSHIQVLRGREFAADTADLDPARAARVLCELSTRRANPRQNPHHVLDLLVVRYGMTEVDVIVRPALEDLLGSG